MPSGDSGGGGGLIIRIAIQFLRKVRERANQPESATGPGSNPSSTWNPQAPQTIRAIRTFTDYLFKPGATHGKDAIFRSLGIGPEDRSVVDDFFRQASQRYSARDFVMGLADQYGQRINVPIDLHGPTGQSATIMTAWMVKPDGSLSLSSPYTGRVR